MVEISKPIGITNLLSDGLTAAYTDPEVLAIMKERQSATWTMLQQITPLRQEILIRRFGIGRERQNLATVAKELGIPKKALRTEEKQALYALRFLAQKTPFNDTFSS